jgi:hypothetical protein
VTDDHQRIINEAVQRAAARLVRLAHNLSFQTQADGRGRPMLPGELAQGPLGQGLAAIAAAAEGEDVDHAVLAETIQRVLETLFVPLYGDVAAIPAGFYATPLGEMIAAAQARLYTAGDVMTAAAAARRLGMSRSNVTRLMNTGRLPYIRQDGIRRPLRAGVEALQEARKAAEAVAHADERACVGCNQRFDKRSK